MKNKLQPEVAVQGFTRILKQQGSNTKTMNYVAISL